MITSNLQPFLKNVTCSVTGHRTLFEDMDFEKLKKQLKEIYEKGFSIFLVGMAAGFDLLCFKALLQLKDSCKDLKICAVIPCEGQEKYFKAEERRDYQSLLPKADYVVKEDREYFRGCMLKRNDYMLENSSLVFAYYKNTGKGGTLYTINGAKKRNLQIIFYGD
jgi:uncharacterized phage-like protein YoqJ